MVRLGCNFVNATPRARTASEAIVAVTPPGRLLPSPLDRSVHRAVARAVARAAMDSGVATREPPAGYFED